MTDATNGVHAEPAPTPATALRDRFRTETLTLSTGVVVTARKLSLMRELLGGSLPTQVLDWIVFQGATSEITDYAQRSAEIYKARLYVVARILAAPRLVLGRGKDIRDVQPDYAAGEIGPLDLTHEEVWEIYSWGILGVVPDAVTAPFRAELVSDTGGTGEPGLGSPPLSQEPEPVSRADGNR